MIGERIIELERVDSTNTYASGLLQEEMPADGTVVWAHDQFAGRGQHPHTWSSEAGLNLTCSIFLRPRFLDPASQFQLNKAITLGVLDYIRTVVSEHPGSDAGELAGLRIKWPNDLYAGLFKLGGILIENRICGNILESSVVGIGLNINQLDFQQSLHNPISLAMILKEELDVKESLIRLCSFLDCRYLRLQEGDSVTFDRIFDEALLGYGEWRRFRIAETEAEGKIRGVDELGRIKIEGRDGTVREYAHGEVGFILE